MSTTTNRPTHRVYAVTKKGSDDKGFWHTIGAAWPHQGGKGFSLKLDLIPINGAEIVIRAADAAEVAQGGAA